MLSAVSIPYGALGMLTPACAPCGEEQASVSPTLACSCWLAYRLTSGRKTLLVCAAPSPGPSLGAGVCGTGVVSTSGAGVGTVPAGVSTPPAGTAPGAFAGSVPSATKVSSRAAFSSNMAAVTVLPLWFLGTVTVVLHSVLLPATSWPR